MSNVERFLAEFNALHRSMKIISGKPDDGFASLLNYLKNRHPVVGRYYNRLNVIRELRNLLVHEHYSTDTALAYPSEEVIAELDVIRQRLEKPGRVGDFFIKDVESFHVTDPLTDLLKSVRLNDYSKFPVFSDWRMEGVLSDTGILHWLSNRDTGRPLDLSRVTIEQVITTRGGYDEVFLKHKVVSPDMSLYAVEEWFANKQSEGEARALLLISEKEKIRKKSDLLGMITGFDLREISNRL